MLLSLVLLFLLWLLLVWLYLLLLWDLAEEEDKSVLWSSSRQE